MSEPHFNMTAEIDDRTGAILAVYFQVREGKAYTVKEVAAGAAFANYDRMGRLLGVELLAPCEVTVLNQLTNKEPAKYKKRINNFLKDTMPKKMALATA